MRKDKLYFLTFISVTIIYVVVALIAIRFALRSSSLELVTTQLEIGKKEARSMAILVGHELSGGVVKDSVISHFQASIDHTDQESIFISILDWSGRIVCHPDVKQVGQKIGSNESFVSSVADDLSADEFYNLLMQRKNNRPENTGGQAAVSSDVFFMFPVQGSDWIVASNANLKRLISQLNRLRDRFYVIFAVLGLIIIPAFVITVRFIGSKYENRLELQKQKLEDEVLNFSKLNRALDEYQQKVNEDAAVSEAKKRILTHRHNELLSIPTEDIAHIYTENTVTYVVCFDSSRSTTNASLDELYSQLDENYFFRANRQYIIAISSIEKIVKYGNNQLKLLTFPETKTSILISKNRAAEFKNWLNL
ncbi:LytTR family transcriptional regulator DNA-binding domain-containing protein [Pricia sp. S334]|uniref:LytTR family transcriptional regulator DNA-binding domain-containing protein n=1 Tax=Pricia mediterranea TaxID=3076079 RepID=A0ABU3L4H1_9FLAO|nr:LytTR family transcriptional regulator DNA-binding domain-containing protein [Pricia sp. S334]MDT7828640.1 LytTR family transcriptional regulator DNA-binding domain-containing protein [Pricia sp. S334]